MKKIDHETHDYIEWREIPGLPGYLASSDGRIMAPQRELNQYITADYPAVWVPDARRYYHVHRLVAMAFHGEPPEGKPLVRHINDIGTDNRAENLMWGDSKENSQDAVRNGRRIGRAAWRKAA